MSECIEVTPDLLAGFLDEAPAYLASLDEGLMAFEEQARNGTIALRDESDHERMNEMFRAAHSLKGLAASLGFLKMRDLTHVMESLFDEVRTGKREMTAGDLEHVFAAVDKLRRLVDELTQSPDEPVSIESEVAALETVLARTDASAAAPAPADEAGSAAAASSGLTCDLDLLQKFVEATAEALDDLDKQLLTLEEQPQDADVINTAFRCAHNIKGASGAVGCRIMGRLTHEMETVLDFVRKGELAIETELISALFGAADRLRADLNLIQDGRYAEIGQEPLPDLFSHWISKQGQTAMNTSPASTQAAPTQAAPAAEEIGIRVKFQKHSADAPILACVIYNRLADLATSIRAQPDVFTLDGDSTIEQIEYYLVSDEKPAELERVIGAYPIEGVEVSPPAPAAVSEAAAPEPPSSEPPAAAPSPPPAAASPPSPARAAPSAARPAPAKQGPPAKQGGSGARVGETIRVDLERLDQLMNLGGELVITKARFTEIARKLSTLFTRTNLNYLVDEMTDRLNVLRRATGEMETARDARRLAGELSEATLHLADDFQTIRSLTGRLHESRATMNEFTEAVHSLNRISEGMQRRIMQTRMVAIGPLFQRFRRVVRDISKATGKNVELTLHGEATELDKRMIDELVDPLTHMVRNSVDHGVEVPEDRRAADKPETGQLALDAFHRGRHICIEVRDDGKGMDVAQLRRKIIERDLASAVQVEQLSDQEVLQYIFRPGFSTAEKVTDLSGRGMGMDIVKTKIDELGGTVTLSSRLGEGTTFTINLPLTLAIIPAMMMRIGAGAYAVPLEMVVEITTVPRGAVKHIQRRAAIQLRDKVIPLTRLENVLSLAREARSADPDDHDEATVLTVMILGCQNERLGLVVDELIGQEDIVIKDIAANFRNVEGVAGASIMGNGAVSLILDVGSLMSNFAQRGARGLAPVTRPAPGAVPVGAA